MPCCDKHFEEVARKETWKERRQQVDVGNCGHHSAECELRTGRMLVVGAFQKEKQVVYAHL